LLVLASTSLLQAQTASPPRYRFTSDTLRYREETSSRSSMTVPSGDIVIENEHDATIGLSGAAGSRVFAWYEQLALREKGPRPASGPVETGAILKKPFTLSISPRGAVRTEATPAIPAAISSKTDLTRQFDDFLISLPAAPLRVGSEWTDTIVVRRSDRADSSSNSRHIRTHRVERDTVVSGMPAVVIALTQVMQEESVAPLPGQPMLMRTRLEGKESGRAVFLTAAGRLHFRERTGSMAGQLTISGGPQPVTIPQRFEYTSSITHVGGAK
jgi:hypothetical protein